MAFVEEDKCMCPSFPKISPPSLVCLSGSNPVPRDALLPVLDWSALSACVDRQHSWMFPWSLDMGSRSSTLWELEGISCHLFQASGWEGLCFSLQAWGSACLWPTVLAVPPGDCTHYSVHSCSSLYMQHFFPLWSQQQNYFVLQMRKQV